MSFASPCILPLAPGYMAFLAGASNGAPQRGLALRRAAFFALGFSVLFVAMGAAASGVGGLVARWKGELSLAAGALIVVMGLHFMGVLRIPLLWREARLLAASAPAGDAGAFVAGLAFAFGWTPCAGPVLATILIVASQRGGADEGAALLAAYAGGLAIPFLLAAVFVESFRRFILRFRRFMPAAQMVTGLLLVATGLAIASGRLADAGQWLMDTFPAFQSIG